MRGEGDKDRHKSQQSATVGGSWGKLFSASGRENKDLSSMPHGRQPALRRSFSQKLAFLSAHAHVLAFDRH